MNTEKITIKDLDPYMDLRTATVDCTLKFSISSFACITFHYFLTLEKRDEINVVVTIYPTYKNMPVEFSYMAGGKNNLFLRKQYDVLTEDGTNMKVLYFKINNNFTSSIDLFAEIIASFKIRIHHDPFSPLTWYAPKRYVK